MVEHQLTNTSRRIDRIVDAIADGTASGALKATLADLEAEKEQLEDERQGLNATSDVADLHPNLPELYRRRVAELEVTLRRCPAERAAAGQILRPPIEGIVVHPGERHGETRIEVAGKYCRHPRHGLPVARRTNANPKCSIGGAQGRN